MEASERMQFRREGVVSSVTLQGNQWGEKCLLMVATKVWQVASTRGEGGEGISHILVNCEVNWEQGS